MLLFPRRILSPEHRLYDDSAEGKLMTTYWTTLYFMRQSVQYNNQELLNLNRLRPLSELKTSFPSIIGICIRRICSVSLKSGVVFFAILTCYWFFK